jgi:hypothetical protein
MDIEGGSDLDRAGNIWMELQFSNDPVKPILCVCMCVFIYILYTNRNQVRLLDINPLSDVFPENYSKTEGIQLSIRVPFVCVSF